MRCSGWITDVRALAEYVSPVRLGHFGAAVPGEDVSVTPAWYDFTGAEFRITIAEWARKARLLRANPRGTLTVDDGLEHVRGVMVSGVVRLTTADHDEVLLAHCRRYAQGEDPDRLFASFGGEQGLVAHLAPDRVRSWP
jgi:hypothetical protein